MLRDKEKFPGLFIVFEGIDGTGKSTQIKKLFNYLAENRYEVVSYYQPTHGTWGKKLRELFIKGHIVPIKEEIQYSVNDRRESVEQQILPALKENKIVLLDRYYWSNAAYQGILDESYQYILKQNNEFPEPDIILYFDIDVNIAINRIKNERKEIPNQFEALNHLTNSKKIFEQIIAEGLFNCTLISIPASKDIETIFNIIVDNILPFIKNWEKTTNHG